MKLITALLLTLSITAMAEEYLQPYPDYFEYSFYNADGHQVHLTMYNDLCMANDPAYGKIMFAKNKHTGEKVKGCWALKPEGVASYVIIPHDGYNSHIDMPVFSPNLFKPVFSN